MYMNVEIGAIWSPLAKCIELPHTSLSCFQMLFNPGPKKLALVVILLTIALLEQWHNRFPSGSPAWILLVQVLVVMLIYGRSLPFIHLEEMTGSKIPDCVGKAHLRIRKLP